VKLPSWVSALVSLIAGGIVGGGLGALAAHHQAPTPAPVRHAARPLRATPSPPAPELAREQTLLFLGTDATGGGERDSLDSNSDTMLLVHLSPAHRVGVLAIPRDTRAAIPGHRVFKINAANVWGGPELACRTVSDLLGVPIDHYLVLNLTGVRTMVDALGGLDVTVPKRMHYVDHTGHLFIDFRAGRQHLSGRQVEAYLRFRHDDEGDIGRVRRQQAFLLEAAHQVFTPAHLWQLPGLWPRLKAHTQTDLSPIEVVRLVSVLRQLDPRRDLEMTSIPGHENATEGPWYWIADLNAIEPFLERVFHKPADPDRVNLTPRVMIENDTGRPNRELQGLIRMLGARGYRVADVRRGPERGETTVITQRGDRAGAETLAGLMGTGEVVVAGIGARESDFTLQVGSDWQEVAERPVAESPALTVTGSRDSARPDRGRP